MSAAMEPAGSPVSVKDGDFSLPDAPKGKGRPKSQKDSNESFRCRAKRKKIFCTELDTCDQ